jgi:hypothetical protein
MSPPKELNDPLNAEYLAVPNGSKNEYLKASIWFCPLDVKKNEKSINDNIYFFIINNFKVFYFY